MALGLYGKLPAKRDFVARDVPFAVLTVLERWLQGALAQSRDTLGERWTEVFLTAPIWRFWWAGAVAGQASKGAMMPSVDGAGRYFPLVLLAMAEEGLAYPEPSAVDEEWFAALEDILLSALSAEGRLEGVVAQMAALAEPVAIVSHVEPLVARPETIWWTLGGPGFAAQRIAWSALPPHSFYTAMLTGDGAAAAQRKEAR